MSSIDLSDAELNKLGITRVRLDRFKAEMDKSPLFPNPGIEFINGGKHHVISVPES